MTKRNIFLLSLSLIFAITCISESFARTKDTGKDGKNTEGVLRAAAGVFDLQQNKVSNIEFYTTNYGIFGLNVRGNVGGGYWPRRSNNQYIFGGGIWFAALKTPPGSLTGEKRKLCVISYNPNSGASWMVPGSIADGDEVQNSLRDKYRVYFGTDFRPNDGAARIPTDGPNWPIWDTDPNAEIKVDRYFGKHEPDISRRNLAAHPKGPAFISGEDIFAVFKDTDLQRYEGGEDIQRAKGYPMRLQFEQMFYTWGFGDYKDFMFMKYDIINFSNDILEDCYMAPAMDMDIALRTNNVAGAANDRTRFYIEDESLNLAVQWSNADRGEGGRDFGYIGFDFLESPAVDDSGYIRKDKKVFTNDEQLGLHAFRNWIIQNDPVDDDGRYNFLSEEIKDGDTGPGDKRFLMSTGPFKLRPQDTARVVVGLIMAKTSKGRDADGTEEDMAELVRKDIFAQRVYDDNFRTPRPPDIANVATKGINNGVIVTWDSTSELSTDPLENGLAFMGYRLFRARRLDLDTFDLDNRPAVSRGPLAWKQIREYRIPPPFIKSERPFGVEGSIVTAPLLDSVEIVSRSGSHRINLNRIPSFNFPWGPYFYQRLIQEGRQAEIARARFGQFVVDSLRVPELQITTTTTVGNVTTSTVSPMPFVINASNIAAVREAMYQYWEQGLGRFEFTKFENERFTIDSLIIPYMAQITNNRTFTDFGDDNNNGRIEVTDRIETTERILNNVDYYYKLRSFDEGEYWAQNTPSKLNDGVEGINTVRAVALASRAGKNSKVAIESVETDRMGGFYNFRVSTFDQERLNQLFANKILKIEFDPIFFLVEAPRLTDKAGTQAINGIYAAQISVYDTTVTPRSLLDQSNAFLEPIPGQIDFYRSIFSENGAVYLGNDTIPAAVNTDTTWIIQRSGSWEDPSPIQQTIGFGFDYTVQQWGGRYRQWNVGQKKQNGNFDESIVRPLMTKNWPMIIDTTLNRGTTGFAKSFNIGPAEYHIEMLPGGTEDITMTYNRRNTPITKTFRVPYLIPQVKNNLTWKRINPETGDSITMGYTSPLPHANIPFIPTPNNGLTTEVRDVPLAQFNMTSYGWVNGTRNNQNDGISLRNDQLTGAISQGKYLLSGVATDGSGDRVDFVNVFGASGTETLFDFANKGATAGGRALTLITPAPETDMAVGDVAITRTFGGALGFPLPQASLTVRITEHSPENQEYTSSMLDSIRVVPNPYLVTHQGERSQYDAKVYFTKLPQTCTIRIYTVNGDLVRTIEHNEVSNGANDRVGMDVWDLLSSNNQRVVSQAFIAQISTPSGAESVVKFSIILGGFRTVPQ
jgi:hypothetical protein